MKAVARAPYLGKAGIKLWGGTLPVPELAPEMFAWLSGIFLFFLFFFFLFVIASTPFTCQGYSGYTPKYSTSMDQSIGFYP